MYAIKDGRIGYAGLLEHIDAHRTEWEARDAKRQAERDKLPPPPKKLDSPQAWRQLLASIPARDGHAGFDEKIDYPTRRKLPRTRRRGRTSTEQTLWALLDPTCEAILQRWIDNRAKLVRLMYQLNDEANQATGLYLSATALESGVRLDHPWVSELPASVIHEAAWDVAKVYMTAMRDTLPVAKATAVASFRFKAAQFDAKAMKLTLPELGMVTLKPVNQNQAYFLNSRTLRINSVRLRRSGTTKRWRVTLKFPKAPFSNKQMADVLSMLFYDSNFQSTKSILAYLGKHGVELSQKTLPLMMKTLGYGPAWRSIGGRQARGYMPSSSSQNPDAT